MAITKILQHWKQQIFAKIWLIRHKFIGIFPLTILFSLSSSLSYFDNNNMMANEEEAEKKQQPEGCRKPLELPLEMHNELIMFANRKTLAVLVSLKRQHGISHIGQGVAVLAAKRLRSIREKLANHQRKLLNQLPHNVARLHRHIPLFVGQIHFANFNQQNISVDRARFIVITKSTIELWFCHQNEFHQSQIGYRNNVVQDIRTLNPIHAAIHRSISLVSATRTLRISGNNGAQQQVFNANTIHFSVRFIWQSEYEQAIEVLSNFTNFSISEGLSWSNYISQLPFSIWRTMRRNATTFITASVFLLIFAMLTANPAGIASSSAQLLLRPNTMAPDFVERLVSEEVEEGAPLKWTVRVSGEPEPTAIWLRDRQTFVEGDGVQMVKEASFTYSLVIDSLQMIDAGQFTCLLENIAGEAQSTADLVVRQKGAPPGKYVHVTKMTQEKQVRAYADELAKIETVTIGGSQLPMEEEGNEEEGAEE